MDAAKVGRDGLRDYRLFWIGLFGGEVGAARFCSGQKRKKHLKVLHLLVGDVGFEPTTHCSQSSCATGLR